MARAPAGRPQASGVERVAAIVPEPTRSQALGCIERMLDFVKRNPSALATPQRGFVRNIGAA